MLTMRVEAEKVSGSTLVSDNADVGFVIANSNGVPLTPNNLTSKIPFRLDDSAQAQVGIRAWPVSVTGKTCRGAFYLSRLFTRRLRLRSRYAKRNTVFSRRALCAFPAHAETALGEINIQLSGNIVDFTCVAEGTTAIKPSRSAPAHETAPHNGEPDATCAVHLKLTGCPSGQLRSHLRGRWTGMITACWR